MEEFQSYFFVGPEELLNIVEEQYEGSKISQISDIKSWIKKTKQTIINESVIATFIINKQLELVVSDRHSEHVVCAGGKNVLSAGEITFNFEDKQVYISEISNQSTGYCPKPASWQAVEIALSKIDIKYPEYFTKAFEFRYCENCQTKNLIKEKIYECVVCQSDLDLEWNFDKMKK